MLSTVQRLVLWRESERAGEVEHISEVKPLPASEPEPLDLAWVLLVLNSQRLGFEPAVA